MIREIDFLTEANGLIELTHDVDALIAQSGVQEGFCIVFCPHTTGAVLVTSRMDPSGFEDLKDEVSRLVPTRIDFKHQLDTPTDAAGHIKSVLLGVSIPFIVSGGRLLIGSSQGIFFMEFDGPRKRKVIVKLRDDCAS